ncbi:acyl-CoA transferase [Natrinema sp. CBA1119]|uniref:CaiB/BaiF CoA transferase family protein n=1 Tax=Natrinema sp. CBA1119 TaxID=1608465 RepID=UPI000BFA5F47|nr:CaiB/BaiF CoA-transferase family protein [Natrinema sp. CBA1119]PGF17752.1 acyl-CoA transferase [Natrinema sp. CBA1119]
MTTTESARQLPLSGITVVELGNLVAAPFTGLMLGDLGADVIKVERPGTGDMIRQSGDSGDAIFTALNRNKRSATIDLQSDAGREAYHELVAVADIVVENLRPGVTERLGIGYDALSDDRDDLIYVSIAGFLQGGPYEDRPGMDVVGQAMSGMMRMTGQPGGKPLRAGTSVIDIGTGVYGAFGAMLALWMRETTGTGQKIDAGLFETASHWSHYWTIFAQLFGDHPPLGSSHPAFGLYDVFETEPDEWLFVGVITERHWPAFCEAIDAPELLADERFETNEGRQENDDTLYDLIQETLRGRDRSAVVDALLDAGVPSAPVNHPSELLDDPHLTALDLLVETQSDDDETVQAMLTPLAGTDIGVSHRRDPPNLGENTAAIFESVGLSDRYAELEANGAFGDESANNE